nr:MAG TPA: hypothetical protein [Caudoviricetes sp.]
MLTELTKILNINFRNLTSVYSLQSGSNGNF